MLFNHAKVLISVTLYLFLHIYRALSEESYNERANAESSPSEEYCLHESFKPRCLKNEVILVKNATYGRMRIGKCITREEVAEQGPPHEEYPRLLGCSTDVLEKLDHNCSGKSDCEIRVWNIAVGNNLPCYRGLKMYLEVSYACISIVDEERSCTVTASKNPVHIIGGSHSPSRLCGTKSQPWVVEASIGKRVSLTLLKVIVPPFTSQMEEQSRQLCYSHGVIVDKAGKRNASICGDGVQREKSLYLSSGNAVNVIFNHPIEKDAADTGRLFILKVEAIGCSDIIPPEDVWLKRNMDAIVMGCYSSRQTWQLSCKNGKWVGVFGNCSQGISVRDSLMETELKTYSPISSDEQVLAMVAIIGCTLAICLAIMCVGAVCLRRYYAQSKKKQAYKTLNYQINTARSQTAYPRLLLGVGTDLSENSGHIAGELSTDSVYVGNGEIPDVNVNSNSTAVRS